MSRPESNLPDSPLVLGQLVTKLDVGGAENLAVQIANAHAAAGGTAHLISLLGPGPLSSRINPDVHVHYLGYRRESIRNPLRFVASIARGFRAIAGVVRTNGIQVLQTHLPDANLWGLAMDMTGRCASVVTIHNNVFFGGHKRNPVGKFLVRKAYGLFFRYCGAVVMCSEEVKKSVLEGLHIPENRRARVFAVTNGVAIPEKLSRAEVAALRARWEVEPGDTFLVAAGRFTEAKNFGCLIEAMGILKRRGLTPKLVIGGDGPQRPELEHAVDRHGLAAQVRLPGNLPDLTRLMQAADGLVMSSRWEGLPLVLLEAMSCGLPVVGTRIKGLSDTIEDGVQGLLVDVDDPSALADGMEKMMRDQEGARQMGDQGRRVVEKNFSFERVYGELTEVYRTALGA